MARLHDLEQLARRVGRMRKAQRRKDPDPHDIEECEFHERLVDRLLAEIDSENPASGTRVSVEA